VILARWVCLLGAGKKSGRALPLERGPGQARLRVSVESISRASVIYYFGKVRSKRATAQKEFIFRAHVKRHELFDAAQQT
jgi:hypothetical protein